MISLFILIWWSTGVDFLCYFDDSYSNSFLDILFSTRSEKFILLIMYITQMISLVISIVSMINLKKINHKKRVILSLVPTVLSIICYLCYYGIVIYFNKNVLVCWMPDQTLVTCFLCLPTIILINLIILIINFNQRFF